MRSVYPSEDDGAKVWLFVTMVHTEYILRA